VLIAEQRIDLRLILGVPGSAGPSKAISDRAAGPSALDSSPFKRRAMTRSKVSVILVTRCPTRSWKPHAVMIDKMASSAFSASSSSANDRRPSAKSRMRAAASFAVLRMAASSRSVLSRAAISAVTE